MSGGFDIAALDGVIHGRLRLGVMAFLADGGTADFNTLKAKLAASDGNLSVQLRKLEDAGYVQIAKSFAGRKPLTRVAITDKGRAAFVAYLDAIEKLLPK
jgi:DNA-binding HxlR family transcriptional regulator